MFNIGDRVLVKIHDSIEEIDIGYPGTIHDIEECSEYTEEHFRKLKAWGSKLEYNPIVKTGRYGIKFDNNPTLIEIPYFWEKDISLLLGGFIKEDY